MYKLVYPSVRPFVVISRQSSSPVRGPWCLTVLAVGRWSRYETENTAGKLYSTFFVSHVALCLLPLRCYRNLGGSEYLLLKYPSVQCYTDSKWILIFSVGACSMLVCGAFFAVLSWEVWRMPAMMIEPKSRSYYVRARQFIFEDFRMEAHRWPSSASSASCHWQRALQGRMTTALGILPRQSQRNADKNYTCE